MKEITVDTLKEGLPYQVTFNEDVYKLYVELVEGEFAFFYMSEKRELLDIADNSNRYLSVAKSHVRSWLRKNNDRVKDIR